MYRNYIFDLYGTLVDLNTDEQRDELWKNLALFYSYNGAFYEKNELEKTYFEVVNEKIEKNKKSIYPDIEIEKVFKKIYKRKSIAPSKELIRETTRLFRVLSTKEISIYENIISILEAIKKKGGKIFILSNGQKEFSIPELKYLKLFNYFDGIYFSGEYGICKPDVQFYEILFKKENLEKNESIMIGNDHTTDIAGACSFGIDSLYIHTNYSKDDAINERFELSESNKCTYSILDGRHEKILEILKI